MLKREAPSAPPPPDPNTFGRVSAQASMMQNYTTPSVPVSDMSGMAVVLCPVEGAAAPTAHFFGADGTNSGRPVHLQQDPRSFSGWRSADISTDPTGKSLKNVLQMAAGVQDGNVIVFAMTTNEIFYRQGYTVVEDRLQGFLTANWVSCGKFPDGTAIRQQIALAPDLTLYALKDTGTKSSSGSATTIWSVDNWQSHPSWNIQLAGMIHAYSVAPVVGGYYCSVSGSGGTTSYVKYYPKGSNDAVTIWSDSSLYSQQLVCTTLPIRDGHAVYSLNSDGHLYYDMVSSGGSKSRKELAGSHHIASFAVVSASTPGTEKVVATKTNELYSQTYDGNSFGDELQIGASAESIVGASFAGGALNYSAMFYLSSANSNLMELQPTSEDSYRRAHVVVPPPVLSQSAPSLYELVAGRHEGVDNFFGIKKSSGDSDGHIHRFYSNSDADTLQHVWTFEECSLKKGALQLTTVTRTDGRLMLFAEDSDHEVWQITFGPGSEWTQLGQFPYLDGEDADTRLLRAGLINGEVVLLALYVKQAAKGMAQQTIVYQLPLTGDQVNHWNVETRPTENVTDISFGTMGYNDGYYLNYSDGSETVSVPFFVLGRSTPLMTLGAYHASSAYSYTRVYGTPTRTEEVFMIDSNKHLQYTTSSSSNGQRVSVGGDGKVTGVSMYYNSDQQLVLVVTGNNTQVSTVTMTSSGHFTDPVVICKSGVANMTATSAVGMYGLNTKSLALELYPNRLNPNYSGDTVVVKANEHTLEDQVFYSWVFDFNTLDQNELPLAGNKVYFQPVVDDVVVRVNGRLITMGPNDPHMTIETNARGAANFTTECTELNAPVFRVWTDLHDDEQTSVLEPNNEEQLYLGSVTQEQLQDAKKNNGEPLFSDPSVVTKDFVASLHETINTGKRSESITRAVDLSHITARKNRSTILHATTHDRAHEICRLDPEVVKNTHFHTAYTIDEHGKRGFKFSRLTREEVEQKINDMDGEDFTGSYADVMQSANNGYIDLHESAFVGEEDTARKGLFKKLKAAVTFVEDEVKKVWKGTIEFVEEVVSCAQAHFAHLLVFFEDVFEWLGEFFDWDAILNTSKLLSLHTTAFLENSGNMLDTASDAIREQLKDMKDAYGDGPPSVDVPDKLRSYVGLSGNSQLDRMNDATSEYGYKGRSGQDPSGTQYGDSPHGNWMADNLNTNLPKMHSNDTLAPDADMLEALKELQEKLGPSLTTAGAGAAGVQQDFGTKVASYGTSASLGLFLDDIKQGLEGVVFSAVETTVEVVLGLAAKVYAGFMRILNRKMEIPLITTLWKTITKGEDLTVMNVFSLAMAIPGTLMCKLMSLAMTSTKHRIGTAYAPVVATPDLIVNAEYQVALSSVEARLKAFGKNKTKMVQDDETESHVISYLLGTGYSVCYGLMACGDYGDYLTSAANPLGNPLTGRTVPMNFVSRAFSGFVGTLGGIAQAISFPPFVTGWGNDAEPEGYRWEMICWGWQLTFNFISMATMDSPVSSEFFETGATTLCGFVHLGLFGKLGVVDYHLMKDSEEHLYLMLISKLIQNITTAVGEASNFGRYTILKTSQEALWAGGEAAPAIIATCYKEYVAWLSIAYTTPAAVSAFRTLIDFAFKRAHIVKD
eukprot:TRINITY_DN3739_c1_g1_i2.p1 TRINITY_DN3739_c1_g1~~TRINITY_DN3739_c1_g1_i2.p1  ORF type:complete len:1616 (+),score=493.78 TRINITY_DN3739_c1_g1_i2:1632-6479(+)